LIVLGEKMSFFHYAYTFKSIMFHEGLKAKIIDSKGLDLRKLQNLAKSVSDNANNELRGILDSIGYDREWLSDPDNDASQAYLWYTINLATSFHPSPSLSSNRFRGSHSVLEHILPTADWELKDVYEIILGNSLSELLDNSEFHVFVEELSLHGGAINLARISGILSHLEKSRQYFSAQYVEIPKVITEFAAHNNLSVDNLLEMAYEDAVDMLETAIDRNEDLYLFRHP
jgi:hypothetical protein